MRRDTDIDIDWIIAIGLILAGSAIGAAFWDRGAVFRFAPLIATLLMALMFIALNEIEPTLARYAEIFLGFLLAGAILNFAIWIQCRDSKSE